MDPVRVAPSGRKRVDDEQVDAGLEQLARLVHEGPEPVAAGFVPGRDDLDHGYDPVSAHVPNDHRALLPAVELGVRLGREPGSRPGEQGEGPACLDGFVASRARLALQGQNVRPEARGLLLGQGVVVGRQQAGVERVADGRDPAVMERVEDARRHQRPVVHRHDALPFDILESSTSFDHVHQYINR